MTAFSLLDVFLKATVTMALALVGVRLARRKRAAHRHLLLAAAFAGLLALPLVSVLAPPIALHVPVALPAAIEAPVSEIVTTLDSTPPPDAGLAGAAPASWTLSLSAVLLALWGFGAAWVLLPFATGLWHVRRLRRTAVPWKAAALDPSVPRSIDVLLHESLAGPMTCGVVRPAILLPADAPAWAPEDLRRAIVHELEHVRRADWLTQILSRAICAGYWFHPLVWIGWRQLVLEAERACDDAVVRRSDATAYADQLVLLAERLSSAAGQPQPAMAGRHDLATRVRALLDNGQARGRAGMRWVVLAGGTASLVVTTMSPLRVVPAFADASSSQTEQGPVRRFEAASIRPCRAQEAPPGPARGTAGGTNASFSPGRLMVPCVTVEQLIYLAHASYGAADDQRLANDEAGSASNDTKVRGGPAWVHSQNDKYAVEATAPGVSERTVLMGAMLRSLLEDRFKLKLHRDTEEVPMYNMTIAKGGLKLKPMRPGDCVEFQQSGPMPAAADGKAVCSGVTSGGRGPNAVWTFGGFKLSAVAGRLHRTLGRHVIDRTGVDDLFIIRLEFHPDENTPGIMWPQERDEDTSAPVGASIFTALEQQLGLKLEPTRAPRGYLVIDHIERPSANSGGAVDRQ